MNKWQETVKRVAKLHPGKSLREILPIAKKEYKKMGHHVSKTVKKGRKGRRSMKGGSDCAAVSGASDGATVSGGSDVAAFDGEWNGEHALIGQGGGSKRSRSKRSRSKRSGSKRRGRGSKRSGSKRRGRGRGSKRR